MLGEELRDARKLRGHTVRELAKRSGLSTETVSGIERGTRYPSLSTLEKLARVLDVSFVVGPDETILEYH